MKECELSAYYTVSLTNIQCSPGVSCLAAHQMNSLTEKKLARVSPLLLVAIFSTCKRSIMPDFYRLFPHYAPSVELPIMPETMPA